MKDNNEWMELNEANDDDLTAMLQPKSLSALSSNNPLKKIKTNLLINMIWAVVICAIYIAIMLYFRIWQVQLCIGIVFLFSLAALYSAFVQYRNISVEVSPHNSLLAELKRHYTSITRWIEAQMKVALFIYPISGTGGFMMGGVVGSGKPVETFMQKPMVLVALVIALAIAVPLCWYLARWMSDYSFGKHLKVLKENIDALEEEK